MKLLPIVTSAANVLAVVLNTQQAQKSLIALF
jgi:hypothetical protein